MDTLDKQLLDAMQSGFPLESRPYAVLGKQLGLTEAQTLERVRNLKKKGIIRRIGGNFDSARLGWHSTLCAASVSENTLDAFVQIVNNYPNVTHNYLRNHAFNIWFTFIGPSAQMVQDSLAEITRKTGVDILYLPATTLFKIKVDFTMQEAQEDDRS